jgi:hypothetical protein
MSLPSDIRAYMDEAFKVSKKEKLRLWSAIFRVLDLHGVRDHGERMSVINQIRTELENRKKKKSAPRTAKPVEPRVRQEPHPHPSPRERTDWLAQVEERHDEISASLENKGPAT